MPNDEDTKPVGRGDTAPQQGERQQRTPRAPHEHDESADSQAQAEPSQGRIADIARKDVEEGRVDTDKGPVLRDLQRNKI
jgi:hypothetical protein